jgi:hypothetical protein
MTPSTTYNLFVGCLHTPSQTITQITFFTQGSSSSILNISIINALLVASSKKSGRFESSLCIYQIKHTPDSYFTYPSTTVSVMVFLSLANLYSGCYLSISYPDSLLHSVCHLRASGAWLKTFLLPLCLPQIIK